MYNDHRPHSYTISSAQGRGVGHGETSRVVKISNLHYNVSQDDLLELFGPDCQTAILQYDQDGRNSGIAHLTFRTQSSATNAIRTFSGEVLDGLVLGLEILQRKAGVGRVQREKGVRMEERWDLAHVERVDHHRSSHRDVKVERVEKDVRGGLDQRLGLSIDERLGKSLDDRLGLRSDKAPDSIGRRLGAKVGSNEDRMAARLGKKVEGGLKKKVRETKSDGAGRESRTIRDYSDLNILS